MADILEVLNQARKESRDGLKVTADIIVFSKPLKEDDLFTLKVTVCNALPPGGGGGWQGDAHFKNIMVTVGGTDDAIPVDKYGNSLSDGPITVPLPLGKDNTLEEGECHDLLFPFKAIHACEAEEDIATVNVTAEFDVARYFTSKVGIPPVTYEIVRP